MYVMYVCDVCMASCDWYRLMMMMMMMWIWFEFILNSFWQVFLGLFFFVCFFFPSHSLTHTQGFLIVVGWRCFASSLHLDWWSPWYLVGWFKCSLLASHRSFHPVRSPFMVRRCCVRRIISEPTPQKIWLAVHDVVVAWKKLHSFFRSSQVVPMALVVYFPTCLLYTSDAADE